MSDSDDEDKLMEKYKEKMLAKRKFADEVKIIEMIFPKRIADKIIAKRLRRNHRKYNCDYMGCFEWGGGCFSFQCDYCKECNCHWNRDTSVANDGVNGRFF